MKASSLFIFLLVSPLFAQLAFENKTIEVSLDPSQSTQTVSFPFLVKGDTTLKRISSGCACLNAHMENEQKSWTTHQTGELFVNIDLMAVKGDSNKTILLYFEDGSKEKLHINYTLPKVIITKPSTFIWKTTEPKRDQTFLISTLKEFKINLTKVVPSNSTFDYKLTKLEDNGSEWLKYELVVTPKSLSRKGLCIFRVETDSDLPRYQSLNLIALVQ